MERRKKLNRVIPNVKVLGILLLFAVMPFGSVYAGADHDWVVKLRQPQGTKAAIEGGWTRDGVPIGYPEGGYTLFCDGEEKSKVIPKGEIAEEPNDAEYCIRIWWPDGTFEIHDSERIPPPGSKPYSHSPDSVQFKVFPITEVPTLFHWSLIIFAVLLAVLTVLVLLRRRREAAA
jgi:hypothetical protein